jgi:TolA-binding protein
MKHLAAKLAVLSIVLALAAPPAHAVNKDMVQLQTQIQELQTAVARLQQSNDERMGVLKDLVQQTTDSVNKMSLSISTLQQQMASQHDSTNAKLDQFSTQLQTLGDSLDEVKARLNNLEKGLKSVQDQQQSIDAALQNLAPSNPGIAPGAPAHPTDNSAPSPQPTAPPPIAGGGYPTSISTPSAVALGAYANTASASAASPSSRASASPPASRAPLTAPSSPSAAILYKTALSDYMAASYALASSEFAAIVTAYPTDPYAGNSLFYLAEIDYRSGKYLTAIKDYDRVLTQFPNNPKVPVSYLHKGQAFLETGKREAGIAQLRALITRFPSSPEAGQARSKLSGMGVPVVPRHPTQ